MRSATLQETITGWLWHMRLKANFSLDPPASGCIVSNSPQDLLFSGDVGVQSLAGAARFRSRLTTI
jgi:hypothetical protein